jgi:phosphoenolpyruvate carboxykinase (GTP)
LDENADNPDGVEVGGVIYGGRDSDTTVPVEEAYNWIHGVTTKGASLESETTAATLGKQGVRKFNPMSNLDFLSVPISKYINNNIEFASKLKKEPKVFSVNYFLKDEAGNFMNAKTDKSVWLKWMELRVHGEAEAIETPTGKIPKYEDLKKLFKDVLNREYSIEDYKKQFCLRVKKSIEKIDRILKIYDEKIPNAPEKLISELNCQKERLIKMQNEKGDVVDPFEI